ncbi:TetR/AcrR family transcriptional regulator [Actinomadura sp. WMMB 499]|uniref:TetR/AcrR family transcriptional regulator n=1 Tax=Actinomadura sp. WMMB 499 TaxID=1219491 RepID=UPI0012441EB8|nr:TetR/AcrR family transcriptional regulator [Actinomadura sp. WMMB 499]QFG23142.1 TetR/AcrR family transcriptional regulator [Actinomadura sp. WMMB 499]
MAATAREPARDRILRAAAELFYAHGVRGVGVDRVIAESGVAKATLYAHFKSKDDLVLAFLAQADAKWRRMLREAADAAGDDPRDRLVGLFDAIGAGDGTGGFRGCVFLNTASESAPGSPVHRATIEHKRAVLAWVRDLAAGARDPGSLARELTLLLDGTMAAAALESVRDTVPAARRAARAIVDRHF